MKNKIKAVHEFHEAFGLGEDLEHVPLAVNRRDALRVDQALHHRLPVSAPVPDRRE